jgi:hypothetical protein
MSFSNCTPTPKRPISCRYLIYWELTYLLLLDSADALHILKPNHSPFPPLPNNIANKFINSLVVELGDMYHVCKFDLCAFSCLFETLSAKT